MSLFSNKEWWSFNPDQVEECDTGCLCVANIDNNTDGQSKIITGNFSGTLRVFCFPAAESPTAAAPRALTYSSEHMLLEQTLPAPILQLTAGRFMSPATGLALAVLHPRQLAVYAVIPSDNTKSTGLSSFLTLNLLYQHPIPRSAFNMVGGPFLRPPGAAASAATSPAAGSAPASPSQASAGPPPAAAVSDCICVQSMDGELAFFSHSSHLFSCQLPDFTVPGPIAYHSLTNTLVTANAAMEIQAFSFASLSQAASTATATSSSTALTAAGGGVGGGAAPRVIRVPPTGVSASANASASAAAARARIAAAAAASGGGSGSNAAPASVPEDGEDNDQAEADDAVNADINNIIAARDAADVSGAHGGTHGHGLPRLVTATAAWTRNLGDHAISLFTARLHRPSSLSPGAPLPLDLVVVAEHGMYILRADTGALRLQRRLEYDPACAAPYTVSRRAAETAAATGVDTSAVGTVTLQHLLVASHQRALLVYRDTTVVWVSRMEEPQTDKSVATLTNSSSSGADKSGGGLSGVQSAVVAANGTASSNGVGALGAEGTAVVVQCAVGTFSGVYGLVVTLYDSGRLTVTYLGTDPDLAAATAATAAARADAGTEREAGYAEMEAETRRLNQHTKAVLAAGGAAGAAAAASAAAAVTAGGGTPAAAAAAAAVAAAGAAPYIDVTVSAASVASFPDIVATATAAAGAGAGAGADSATGGPAPSVPVPPQYARAPAWAPQRSANSNTTPVSLLSTEAWAQRRRSPLPPAVMRTVGRFVYGVAEVVIALRPAAHAPSAAAALALGLRDVTVSVSADSSAVLECETWVFPALPGPALGGAHAVATPDASGNGVTVRIPVYYRIAAAVIPATLALTVTVDYAAPAPPLADGAAQPQPQLHSLADDARWEPRCSNANVMLPFDCFALAVAPVKDAVAAVTIDTSASAAAPLTSLFPDLLAPAIALSPEVARTAAGVLTVALPTGAVATVIGSKKGGRYRVQASHPAALAVMTAEVVARLNLASAATQGGLAVAHREDLPLDLLETAIRAHWGARESLCAAHSALAARAAQHRALQKRALTGARGGGGGPGAAGAGAAGGGAAVDGLALVLRQVFESVSAAAIAVEDAQAAVSARAGELRAVLALTVTLARLNFSLDGKNAELLKMYLPTVVTDSPMPSIEDTASSADADATAVVSHNGETGATVGATAGFEPQGWEETALASVKFILHTSLRRQIPGAAAAAAAATGQGQDDVALAEVDGGLTLAPVKDVGAVVAAVRELFELMKKGARFVVSKNK